MTKVCAGTVCAELHIACPHTCQLESMEFPGNPPPPTQQQLNYKQPTLVSDTDPTVSSVK